MCKNQYKSTKLVVPTHNNTHPLSNSGYNGLEGGSTDKIVRVLDHINIWQLLDACYSQGMLDQLDLVLILHSCMYICVYLLFSF